MKWRLMSKFILFRGSLLSFFGDHISTKYPQIWIVAYHSDRSSTTTLWPNNNEEHFYSHQKAKPLDLGNNMAQSRTPPSG